MGWKPKPSQNWNPGPVPPLQGLSALPVGTDIAAAFHRGGVPSCKQVRALEQRLPAGSQMGLHAGDPVRVARVAQDAEQWSPATILQDGSPSKGGRSPAEYIQWIAHRLTAGIKQS